MRISPGFRLKRARSLGLVSPVRMLRVGRVDGGSALGGEGGDAGQRGAEVALYVDGEGLEGGDVEDLAAGRWRGGEEQPVRVSKQQPIEAPEEGGEGLAGSGGGEDEGAVAAGDGGPAFALRCGGRAEGGAEPLGRDGVKQLQAVVRLRGRRGFGAGFPGRCGLGWGFQGCGSGCRWLDAGAEMGGGPPLPPLLPFSL